VSDLRKIGHGLLDLFQREVAHRDDIIEESCPVPGDAFELVHAKRVLQEVLHRGIEIVVLVFGAPIVPVQPFAVALVFNKEG
jgi:hypothetical protein